MTNNTLAILNTIKQSVPIVIGHVAPGSTLNENEWNRYLLHYVLEQRFMFSFQTGILTNIVSHRI